MASRFVLFFLLGIALLGCPAESPTPPPEDSAPQLTGAAKDRDLILISVDTLRADRLGAWGYGLENISPNIDAMVGQGVRFAEASATRAATWPSLASVLTGLYPTGHGVIINGYKFPDELLTLPKVMQANGYQTGAFLSNMCDANHQGWDAFSCSAGKDGKAIQDALQWVESRDSDRPLFLWVHLFGAHPPYYNGGDRATVLLDPDYDGFLKSKHGLLKRIMREKIELNPRDVEHLDAIYDGAVMGTDGLVGRLLQGLEAKVPPDNAVYSFLSDHGEDLYDHHEYIFHACSVYQTGLHVPFSLSAPGLIDPGTVSHPVELIDLMPTLLDLLALESLTLHGASLVPYLERPDRGGVGKGAFSEYDNTAIRTVRLGPWKLVDNPDSFSPICLKGAPADHYPLQKVELYNLEEDPEETRNLAEERPDQVRLLQELLKQRFDFRGRAETQELSDELKAELCALGYIQNCSS